MWRGFKRITDAIITTKRIINRARGSFIFVRWTTSVKNLLEQWGTKVKKYESEFRYLRQWIFCWMKIRREKIAEDTRYCINFFLVRVYIEKKRRSVYARRTFARRNSSRSGQVKEPVENKGERKKGKNPWKEECLSLLRSTYAPRRCCIVYVQY